MLSLSSPLPQDAAINGSVAATFNHSLKLPLVLEPGQLVEKLTSDDVLVVDLRDEDAFAAGHLPNAVQLSYEGLTRVGETASGLLPDADKLSKALSSIGLTPRHHVVAYDQDAGAAASRLLWTLDVLGHRSFSLLNGGFSAWLDAGFRVSDKSLAPRQSNYVAKPTERGMVSKQQVLQKIGDPKVTFLDARTPEEYSGDNLRTARGGHIPGAVNMNWTDATDPGKRRRLRSERELKTLLAEKGITPDKEIIPYCQTHHRSSHTYVMLKHMGFENVNAYAGSWSEWGNSQDVPVETTAIDEN